MTARAVLNAGVVIRRGRLNLRLAAALTAGLATLGLATAISAVAGADPTPAAAGEFVPLRAASLVKTASGIGWSGKLQPGATMSVPATGVLGVPASGVLAVMLHVTTSHSASDGALANGNLWAWPTGSARPSSAIVANAPTGLVADNTAIVQVGTGGKISFFNGRSGTAVDVTADVEGYVTSAATPAAGATFAPLTPTRILDTAAGTGGRSTPLTRSAAWTFRATGTGGIPASGVSAVVLNVGAKGTTANCWVQVQPAGTPTSRAVYPRVDTYAGYPAQQLAVVAPDANGNITFSTNCPSTDVFVDAEGYYLTAANGSAGDVYVPIAKPPRVIDTRSDVGITGQITAGRTVSGPSAVAVTGVGGVPAGADAVALSIGTMNGSAHGYNTIWTDGAAQPTDTSSVDVEPNVVESNLMFLDTGPTGKIDVAGTSSDPSESNDLYVDIEGYFARLAPTPAPTFTTPHYYPAAIGDTYFNTVGPDGQIVLTSNDSHGVNGACADRGGDIVVLHASGTNPAGLKLSTVNCMTGFGPRGGGRSPDGCSWKTGGITRIGRVIYLAVARQLRSCSFGKQAHGLQPSFNASIIKSADGGKTWTNPWGMTRQHGAAPPWDSNLHRYKAMFPGQSFSAPFFIQYGPGNTHTVDGAGRYLYAVSNDGYAYNGSYLHLGRVPLNKIQDAGAWEFYHGRVGGGGTYWTHSNPGATRILYAKNDLSQPAIQYVPALRRYVLMTFFYPRAHSDFPTRSETPYTRIQLYTAPKPWGPWTRVFDHDSQRDLWCAASPCQLTEQPGADALTVGTPSDWLGFYDPVLVQKFVFTRPLDEQAMFTSGDFKNAKRYAPREHLYRLHVLPLDLISALRS